MNVRNENEVISEQIRVRSLKKNMVLEIHSEAAAKGAL